MAMFWNHKKEDSVVTCPVCGCLVSRASAIRKVEVWAMIDGRDTEVFFCRKDAPKWDKVRKTGFNYRYYREVECDEEGKVINPK